MVNVTPLGSSEGNCSAYCSPLDNRSKSFGEVDAFLSLETLGDEFGFLLGKLCSLNGLELENPFVGDSSCS